MRIGLCMIVKDEAHIIHEALECTRALVDTYCIVDTGSSDRTIEAIREFYKPHGIEGEIHERPWVDFGTNRTQALQLCDGKMDYALVIDADDLMSFPEGGRAKLEALLEKEEPSGVQILIKQSTLDYYRSQVFKIADKWRYVGVLHEYPSSGVPNAKSIKLPTTFWMESRRLGGRTVAGNKLERDIAVLEKGLVDEPNNERYMFYLAQSYWDAGQNDKARAMYEKRFNHGGWAEETWFAAYRVGECHKRLGQILEFEFWMQKAHNMRPWRAEPMYKLTEYFRSHGQCHKAYHYLQIGRKIAYPKDDVLFVEKFPHDGGFDYEATIIDYYVHTERIHGLRDTVRYLLKRGEHIHNVLANLQFYAKPLDAKFETLPIPNPFGSDFHASAVSVLEYPYANVRYVNYSLPGYKAPNDIVITNNAYVDLRTGEVICAFPQVSTPHETRVRGLEDLRLYRDTSGALRFTATNYYAYEKDRVSIVSGVYDAENKEHSGVVAITSPLQAKCEKNWVHIPGADELIYSWHPLRTGRIEGSELRITRTVETPPLFSLFRGSGAPFRVGTHWWALVHLVEYSDPRRYYHCFVELSADFVPTRVSLPFVFKTVGIEYCITAQLAHDTIVCYPSFRDASPQLCRIPISSIEWMCVPSKGM